MPISNKKNKEKKKVTPVSVSCHETSLNIVEDVINLLLLSEIFIQFQY